MILDDAFITSDDSGKQNENKIISRRFLFELTRVEGNADLDAAKSELYCYLRSSRYHYQDDIAHPNTDAWPSVQKQFYIELLKAYLEDDPDELALQLENLKQAFRDGTYGSLHDSFFYTVGIQDPQGLPSSCR